MFFTGKPYSWKQTGGSNITCFLWAVCNITSSSKRSQFCVFFFFLPTQTLKYLPELKDGKHLFLLQKALFSLSIYKPRLLPLCNKARSLLPRWGCGVCNVSDVCEDFSKNLLVSCKTRENDSLASIPEGFENQPGTLWHLLKRLQKV